MLGTSSDGPSPIKIAMSRDAGETWDPADSAVLANSTGDFGYETGPTPSLMANGRVYRAMERFRKPFVWGVDYEAVVVSAAIDSDLLDPQSWRLSASLPFNLSWAPASWRSKMQAPGRWMARSCRTPAGCGRRERGEGGRGCYTRAQPGLCRGLL